MASSAFESWRQERVARGLERLVVYTLQNSVASVNLDSDSNVKEATTWAHNYVNEAGEGTAESANLKSNVLLAKGSLVQKFLLHAQNKKATFFECSFDKFVTAATRALEHFDVETGVYGTLQLLFTLSAQPLAVPGSMVPALQNLRYRRGQGLKAERIQKSCEATNVAPLHEEAHDPLWREDVESVSSTSSGASTSDSLLFSSDEIDSNRRFLGEAEARRRPSLGSDPSEHFFIKHTPCPRHQQQQRREGGRRRTARQHDVVSGRVVAHDHKAGRAATRATTRTRRRTTGAKLEEGVRVRRLVHSEKQEGEEEEEEVDGSACAYKKKKLQHEDASSGADLLLFDAFERQVVQLGCSNQRDLQRRPRGDLLPSTCTSEDLAKTAANSLGSVFGRAELEKVFTRGGARDVGAGRLLSSCIHRWSSIIAELRALAYCLCEDGASAVAHLWNEKKLCLANLPSLLNGHATRHLNENHDPQLFRAVHDDSSSGDETRGTTCLQEGSWRALGARLTTLIADFEGAPLQEGKAARPSTSRHLQGHQEQGKSLQGLLRRLRSCRNSIRPLAQLHSLLSDVFTKLNECQESGLQRDRGHGAELLLFRSLNAVMRTGCGVPLPLAGSSKTGGAALNGAWRSTLEAHQKDLNLWNRFATCSSWTSPRTDRVKATRAVFGAAACKAGDLVALRLRLDAACRVDPFQVELRFDLDGGGKNFDAESSPRAVERLSNNNDDASETAETRTAGPTSRTDHDEAHFFSRDASEDASLLLLPQAMRLQEETCVSILRGAQLCARVQSQQLLSMLMHPRHGPLRIALRALQLLALCQHAELTDRLSALVASDTLTTVNLQKTVRTFLLETWPIGGGLELDRSLPSATRTAMTQCDDDDEWILTTQRLRERMALEVCASHLVVVDLLQEEHERAERHEKEKMQSRGVDARINATQAAPGPGPAGKNGDLITRSIYNNCLPRQRYRFQWQFLDAAEPHSHRGEDGNFPTQVQDRARIRAETKPVKVAGTTANDLRMRCPSTVKAGALNCSIPGFFSPMQMDMYSRCFSFLLELKGARKLLQQAHFFLYNKNSSSTSARQNRNTHVGERRSAQPAVNSFGFGSHPRTQLLLQQDEHHVLQDAHLLRSEMLHFVQGLESALSMRVAACIDTFDKNAAAGISMFNSSAETSTSSSGTIRSSSRRARSRNPLSLVSRPQSHMVVEREAKSNTRPLSKLTEAKSSSQTGGCRTPSTSYSRWESSSAPGGTAGAASPSYLRAYGRSSVRPAWSSHGALPPSQNQYQSTTNNKRDDIEIDGAGTGSRTEDLNHRILRRRIGSSSDPTKTEPGDGKKVPAQTQAKSLAFVDQLASIGFEDLQALHARFLEEVSPEKWLGDSSLLADLRQLVTLVRSFAENFCAAPPGNEGEDPRWWVRQRVKLTEYRKEFRSTLLFVLKLLKFAPCHSRKEFTSLFHQLNGNGFYI
ncbi:unnamed protein product [Amoebophrya sp. A120]|nr:unnamed protein product [Amoebophrya sp. A120]|eukprot:GSA120T00015026001.1